MTKILIVGMTENPGGMESFVLNYLNQMDQTNLHFDFLSNTLKDIAYEEIFKKMGATMYHIPSFSKSPIQNKIQLHNFFKEHAYKYDGIWVHLNSLANIDYLKLAKQYNIPTRIVHSHNSEHMENGIKGNLKKINHVINKKILKNYATEFWACSNVAANFFFEDNIRNKVEIIPNAINVSLSEFNIECRKNIRHLNRISAETFVLGNVGRLQYQKNQEFMLEVFKVLHKIEKNSKLIFVGDGPDREYLQQKVKEYELVDSVIFAGLQSNIPEWLSAFDVFFFPSRFEGLSIAALEAQANGLPVITSTGVTKEIDITNLTTFIDLEAPISVWVDTLLSYKDSQSRQNKDVILDKFIDKHFEIVRESERLRDLLVKGNR
ncbi:TPA: glycosyltransferase family 1 protein [Streptococcus suis]|nr:glycosyltransferase family 1 protein [Streptococcus suis]